MTTYVRINADGTPGVTYELTTEQYAALVANGKAQHLRLFIVDAQPAVPADKVLLIGPVVVGPVEAHQTWVLRSKTPAELDADLNAADYALLKSTITELTTDIQAYNANPDVTGTVAQILAKVETRLRDVERQMRRNNRILRYYLRSLA